MRSNRELSASALLDYAVRLREVASVNEHAYGGLGRGPLVEDLRAEAAQCEVLASRVIRADVRARAGGGVTRKADEGGTVSTREHHAADRTDRAATEGPERVSGVR